MATEWVQLELDVHAFDASAFAPIGAQLSESQIELTTLAELGDTEANRRLLYELNATCSADIPDRGPFHTWENYLHLRINVPSFDPAGVVLALDQGTWVGMSAASDHATQGHVFNEMTGVLRSHRRHNIALAMKLHVVQYAAALHAPVIRTIHHPGNAGMIALNRQMGYVDGTW